MTESAAYTALEHGGRAARNTLQRRLAALLAVFGVKQTAKVVFPSSSIFPISVFLRSTLLLAIVGASVGLCLGVLLADLRVAGFVVANTVERSERTALLLSLLAGVGLSLAVSALALFWKRSGVLFISVLADAAAPLAIAVLLPSLFSAAAWHGKPLPYLAQLGFCVVYLEWATSRSLHALNSLGFRPNGFSLAIDSKITKTLCLSLVVIGATAYALYFSHFTILNHRQLGTTGYDLGIIVNWVHNATHGDVDRCTVLYAYGDSCFGGHAIYAIVSWIPAYLLNPGAESLLILQSVVFGSAAIPLYLFAASQIGRRAAVVVASAYLLFAPLHGPNFYDVHGLPFSIPFQFWLYYAIARRKWVQAVAAVLILFAHREDIAVGLTVFGLFLVLINARPRFGAGLAAIAVTWFVVNKFILMPAFGESTWFANIYKDLQPAGEPSYGGVVKTILSNPAYFVQTVTREIKLVYFLHMMVPVAFLPLRHAALALLLLPGVAFTIMTTGYAPTLSIAFQYTSHWIPYVFLATVLALRFVARRGSIAKWSALTALVFGMLCHSYVFGAVLQQQTFVGGFSRISFEMSEQEKTRYGILQRMLAQIPDDASVAATEDLIAHAAAREDAYTLRSDHMDADFILIRKEGLGFSGTRAVVKSALRNAEYGVIDQGSGLYLLKRDSHSPKTEAVLRRLGLHVSKGKRKPQ